MPLPLDRRATPYPVDPSITLAEFEQAILGVSDEVAAAFDAGGRLALWPRRGTPGSVEFYEQESDFLQGSVVTHSHPTAGPLSSDDLLVAAERNVAQMRVVLPDGVVHFASRPMRGWPNGDALADAADEAILILRRKNLLAKASGGLIMSSKEYDEALFTLRRDAVRAFGVVMDRTDVWR